MRATGAALLGIGLVALYGVGWGSVPIEGRAPFAFDAQVMGPVGSDRLIRIGLHVSGLYASGVLGDVRLAIPSGLEFVSGDTAMKVNLAEEYRVHTIVLRARDNGTHVVRGHLTVNERRFGRDEGEFELAIVVLPDTVMPRVGRTVRQERVAGGQRFRFGGPFMVPIDGPEDFTEDEIATSGKRASVATQAAGVCTLCAAGSRTRVRWVVFVDPQGKIRESRPLGVGPGDSVVVTASRAALQSWTFSPASVRGRQASDWVVVEVPVNASR